MRANTVREIWKRGEAVVNGWEVAAAILPAPAAGGVVLHVVLAVIFVLGLRRA